MKRRTLGILAGSSLIAMRAGAARAQVSAASSLGAGLTPMGSEIAGNADGSIPAWTGGLTSVPAGINVVRNGVASYIPELFPNEQPTIVVDQSNMADHAALLTEGVQAMITKYGFKIKVYPTHRTAAGPQWVYDNIAENHNTARFVAQDLIGGRFGFEGAYGGIPFPVPDVGNPLTAGAQIVWNNNCVWGGSTRGYTQDIWTVSRGQKVLGSTNDSQYKYPYYNPDGPGENYDGCLSEGDIPYSAPSSLVGQQLMVKAFIDPYKNPQEAWELLNGQGRVRRAPEISFDTPFAEADGILNYDEIYGFNGSLERYDWKCLGKREMYVPYNNNALCGAPASEALQDNFINPELVRWEKHRCWVVEATLHPGERNVLARRMLYIDEDTMAACLVDAWDANDNLFKVNFVYNNCRPDLPGVVPGATTVQNLQTDSYAIVFGSWNEAQVPTIKYLPYADVPDLLFDPTHMAASAQY